MFTDNEHYKSELATEIFEKESHFGSSCGNFINYEYKKHEDLNQMLNSNRESLKLEAMKRIIEMIAKGKDASDLFPAVVKNVVAKNIEVKKLVYVYLVRYAEEKQQLALLSISTFQRSLKEPNQLIRASGLKVLSNIRVAVIVPIVLLAIREAAADLSPYVRKTVAHAVPKLYNLDPKLKSELIIIIQKLLQDSEVLVIGSAVMAYTEVCPERVDLIHSVFHKLCSLLTDVDEWGQVVIINTLTRYARSQFVDPNKSQLDSDHQLLLCSSYPLLQSRNSAVVMAVAQLYIHCGSKNVIPLCIRALVRLLHLHTEIQNIVLYNMITISCQNKEMFQPYLKKFFVRTSDSIKIKLLKLDILTNIATDSNITLIVRELQTYIISNDKTFVAASIQAFGKCACSISEITDSCLNGLVRLLSNKDEAIVAESVVVIKTLFQTQTVNCKEIIMQMARSINSITIPQARAAILWLLGENLHTIPQIASVVLCNISKTFSDEHDIVKLQILNLVIKFYIINPQESRLLCQYILDLAKYDVNYDIRDRARLMRNLYKNPKGTIMSQVARVFLVKKPVPTLNTEMTNQGKLFQLGTLSHYINENALGYVPLPRFPIEPASKEVRKVKEFNILEESKGISDTINENSSTTTSSNINSDSESSISSAENEILPLCNNESD